MKKVTQITLSILSCVAVFGTSAVLPQHGRPSRQDCFRKYPSGAIFNGKPAAPDLSTPETREFRTRIREGVAKGVVFDGHYEVAEWGCGGGCLSFAIVDAITGKVYLFPYTVSQVREAGEPLTYKIDSAALHVIGSLNEKDSADRWFAWDGTEF